MPLDFNKYLVFVDEAGDHQLHPYDTQFPVFVLAFCIIERTHYANFIAPQLLSLKLKYFQDSHVILHEREIRKAKGEFSFLTNETLRTEFLNDLNGIIANAEFKVISTVIRKDHLTARYHTPQNPYTLGASFCLERLLYFLNTERQRQPTTVAFEARGKNEDKDLELAFLRKTQEDGFQNRFQIKIVPKISNCLGLQLADMIARPIGRYVMNPAQPNRAYDIIKTKFHSLGGRIDGYGLKIFP